MVTVFAAAAVLDREFLPLRGKLIEVAAALDRIRRRGGDSDDPRMKDIARCLSLLARDRDRADLAEQVQMLFSLPYDPDWRNR
jgi:hypothetical protein